MKKVVVLLAASILTFSVAYAGSAKRLFASFSNTAGVTALSLSHATVRSEKILPGNVSGTIPTLDISSLKVLVLEEASAEEKKRFMNMAKDIDLSRYDMAVEARQTILRLRSKGDRICEMLLLAETGMIWIRCDIDKEILGESFSKYNISIQSADLDKREKR